MKKTCQFISILTVIFLFVSLQNQASEEALVKKVAEPDITHEFYAETSYVGDANLNLSGPSREIDEIQGKINYVYRQQLKEWIWLRVGMSWERFSFGGTESAPIPDTLQSLNAILGLDLAFSEQLAIRFEMLPGLYSDFEEITFDDVNSPFALFVRYIVNPDLEWYLGFSGDPRREYPVVPGAGVKWKFADRWTLSLLVPKPRIEYELNEDVTLYAGGEMKFGTYKVSENFGDEHGGIRLNNAPVDYREVRTGAGIAWRIQPALFLELEAGYMVDRNYDFHNADIDFDTDGAPYGQTALRYIF